MNRSLRNLLKSAKLFIVAVRKQAKRLRQWLYQQYYKFLFLLRRNTLKKFDKLVAQKEAYFTVELKYGGLTDQLVKLAVFYHIGNSLNFKYYFTKLYTERSYAEDGLQNYGLHQHEEQKEDYNHIHNFLGLQDYLKSISVEKSNIGEEPFLLKVDDSFLISRGLANNELLISFLKLRLYPTVKAQEKIHIKVMPNGFSSFFGLFNRLDVMHQSGLDFREAFERNQTILQMIRSKNEEMKYNLVFHIRQGDTAVVQTPWNTFINVWGGIGLHNSKTEFDTIEKARTFKHILVEDYYNFLTSLNNQMGGGLFSIRVFSDGFRRAFKHLVVYKEKAGLTESKIEELRKIEKSYDQKVFKVFENIDQVELVVGEGDQKLQKFVTSLLRADVVVTGTQQRMVSKFLSVYCNPKNMPLVIVLYNKVKPSVLGLASPELIDNYLLVDIHTYNSTEIASQIHEFLKNRYALKKSAV